MIDLLHQFNNVNDRLFNKEVNRFIYKLSTDAKFKGRYWPNNESNLCRLLFLYFFGGFYIDTDIILVNNINNLQRNVIGYQDIEGEVINTASMRFEKHHLLIKICVYEFLTHYNGYWWGYNGPKLITRVLRNDYPKELICDQYLFNAISRRSGSISFKTPNIILLILFVKGRIIIRGKSKTPALLFCLNKYIIA